MHPYRDPPPGERHGPPGLGAREELALYTLMAGVGAIPVITAIAHGATLGGTATIGLVMLAVGLAGLLGAWRSARRGQRR